jgi:hypothetical protein
MYVAAMSLAPFIEILNLLNEKNQPALDGIKRESIVSLKTRRHRPKNAPLYCRAEDTRTHLPETQA